jgi:hypothetical protein
MGETTYVDTWEALQEIMERTRKVRQLESQTSVGMRLEILSMPEW